MPRSITWDKCRISVRIGTCSLKLFGTTAVFVQATSLTWVELVASGELPLKHFSQRFVLKFNFPSPDEIRYRLFFAAGARSVSCLVGLLSALRRVLPPKSDGYWCSWVGNFIRSFLLHKGMVTELTETCQSLAIGCRRVPLIGLILAHLLTLLVIIFIIICCLLLVFLLAKKEESLLIIAV